MPKNDNFAALICSHRSYLMNVAFKRFSRNVDYVNDLVNDAILSALSHEHTFIPGTKMLAWLFTILRNQHYSNTRHFQVFKRKEYLLDHDPTIPANGEDAAALSEMVARIRALRLRDQQALILIIAGNSYEEAATIAGVPVGTMKSRFSRARAVLSKTPIDKSLLPQVGNAIEEFHALYQRVQQHRTIRTRRSYYVK